MKKPKQYTRGLEGIERVIEHLNEQEKKERRAQWIREHYSKGAKQPNTKEEKN